MNKHNKYHNPEEWQKHFFGLSAERWALLRNKSVWITGAGTGYGSCMALALAAAGAEVFLSGRRIEKLRETVEKIKSYGISANDCHLIPLDITDRKKVIEACKQVSQYCYTLYGLVNNAALPSKGGIASPLLNGSCEDFEGIMNTNFISPWFLTKTIFPHMKKGGQARILFISSEAGWAFTPGFGPYNISKAAVNNLSASMAYECEAVYPGLDAQINVVVPGQARTEMNQGSSESPYLIVPIVLALLSHPEGGPNGNFFHRDGRNLNFCYSKLYGKSVI